MRPRTLVTVALVLGFFAFLAWSTLEAQKVSCNVCVEFNGKQNCATASDADAEAATRSAQNTACGPVTSGMNDAIACGNKPPVSQQCQTR